MNGKEVGGEEIEIVLAKPPDKKRKERQAARQTTRNTGWGGADVLGQLFLQMQESINATLSSSLQV